jgi:lactam utilization protein B
MKKTQAFLVLGFIVTLSLCAGFFMQKENEKNKRIKVENVLISFVQERDKLTIELNKRLQEREKKIDYLLAALDRERKVKTKLVSKVKSKGKLINLALTDKKDIELEKIVVTSLSEIEGKVLAVDTQNRLVVINLGSSDNVKAGDRFSIYRGNDFIADIELVKIQSSLSAAAILSEEKDIKVAVNDLVRVF